jgi:hypothetical protein
MGQMTRAGHLPSKRPLKLDWSKKIATVRSLRRSSTLKSLSESMGGRCASSDVEGIWKQTGGHSPARWLSDRRVSGTALWIRSVACLTEQAIRIDRCLSGTLCRGRFDNTVRSPLIHADDRRQACAPLMPLCHDYCDSMRSSAPSSLR